jgi:YidC/Oxa1 family membrane protein insertase
MIPMGWSFFSYINKLLVIPVFSLFDGSGFGYGWVIMILTFLIKGLLFPIGYMTYKSSAKMKVLKPETDAITEKYGKDGDPMKKQQETMALYGRAGVSPFSGCLPLIFQMFVLIALFNFFPAAFELRQKGFLWADDLSTYDSVLDFGFNIPLYGDHVSMFALLMFVSTLAFTFYQQKMFPNQQGNMPGMKFMMYVMPFIFLGFMNSYSAGLSWYYFIANVINIVQNLVLRRFVDDNKLRAEIEANLKNPAKKKKGGFAARLEEMTKQRQQQMRKK